MLLDEVVVGDVDDDLVGVVVVWLVGLGLGEDELVGLCVDVE